MGLKAAMMTALPALASAAADTAAFDVTKIMQDSVNTVQSQAFSVLGIVVPAIVLITGAVVGIKFGISWIRKIRGS
ncbi:MAG: hypothetical protein NC302_02810 [Bacteroidales bacterium]|nr:hypothetical protein [Bacteroidales bacterium]MCM1414619.1 hypothetical protein [bacterium]MCM1423884.1 hypothetical protein [bacterium]